jgi:nitroreductase
MLARSVGIRFIKREAAAQSQGVRNRFFLVPGAAASDNYDVNVCVSSTRRHQSSDVSHSPSLSPSPSSEALQSLIKSRRTISNFKEDTDPERLRSAIRRAVACGQNAPNHKRTEPFSFRLLLSEASRNRLANICFEVNVRKMRTNQKGSEASIQAEADRKREKWSKIPAYLVALVKSAPLDRSTNYDSDSDDQMFYPPIPYQYPTNTQQMEDYGSVCAAIQSILLSLHAEGYGSKWATGPVPESLAFRDLVQCKDDELVAALIMIGEPKRIPRPPRRRREIDGDLLREVC